MRLDRARELVLAHGWNATSYQILNPGIRHWFSPDSAAVVGYTRRGNVLLTAGGPVCSPHSLVSVCAQFEAFARERRLGVCYVCAEERLRALFARSPEHSAVALGAQPVWNPCGCRSGRSSIAPEIRAWRSKGSAPKRPGRIRICAGYWPGGSRHAAYRRSTF